MAILPAPQSYAPLDGETFELTPANRVVVAIDDPALTGVAERFAAWLRRATGFALPVEAEPGDGAIVLALRSDAGYGREGYTLRVDRRAVRVEAGTAEGVFRGLTTLRLMLPAASEATTVQHGPWTVAGAEIVDAPRFAYRGTMLDVARHFFPVDDVLRYVDLISLYKVNHLHLHLTDDQGWRLTVPDRPRLTEVGGPSDIDGGPGGCYSEADYARIVSYAAERFIDVVPEIDFPGHSTTALRAHPELSLDGTAPPPYRQAGISDATLDASNEETFAFLGDVYDAVTAVTGEFVHLGADEAAGTPHDEYATFVARAAQLAADRGRRVVVWHEAGAAELPPGSVAQYWGTGQEEAIELAHRAVAAGHQLLLSPGDHAYLDMKYDDDTPYGLTWAGLVPVSAAYDWNPATLLNGVSFEAIIGVESALWTETVADRAALDHMAFPRLASIAELGWSPSEALAWEDHRHRLAAQGLRWDILGVNFYRSPEIDWEG